LQCVAVCCSVLQCVAVCCSVLQCVAVCCSVLMTWARSQHTGEEVDPHPTLDDGHGLRKTVHVCCSVLQCIAVSECVLQRVAVRCRGVAVCCSASQCRLIHTRHWMTVVDFEILCMCVAGRCSRSVFVAVC